MNELDDVLSTDEPLVPSSGFAARVMDAVHDAAAEPPPFPFPWARFTAGLAAAATAVVSGAVFVTSPKGAAIADALSPILGIAPEIGSTLAITLICLAAVRSKMPSYR